MNNRDLELQALSGKISDTLKNQSRAEPTQPIKIQVSGNNSGAIYVGSTVHINTPPAHQPSQTPQSRPPEPGLHERDSKALARIRRQLVAENTKAKWRCYLNFPFMLGVLILFLTLTIALWSGYLLFTTGVGLFILSGKFIAFIVLWAVTFWFLTRSLYRIKRSQLIIIEENQHDIDVIDKILARRKA